MARKNERPDRSRSGKEQRTAMSNIIEQTVVTAPDISCAHCATAITNAVSAIPGVESVNVDIPSKRVTIGHQPGSVDMAEVARVMDDEGYPIS